MDKNMLQNRREFLKLGAGAATAICFSSSVPASADELKLKLTPLRLEIGASKPFRALHISDTHLCLADERENDRKRTLAARRHQAFSRGQQYFDLSLAHARENDQLLLHTGDLIDFTSELNLETVEDRFRGAKCFVSAGNHEFSQYVGEAREDDAYKAQSFDRVQKAFPNNLTFCSKVHNGINFVAVDDVYYNFTEDQLRLFKLEVEKGLPIVMMCHCPLYTPELYDHVVGKTNNFSYLVNVPDKRTDQYDTDRKNQQQANNPTHAFCSWLKTQPLVKAILCGHLHRFWQGNYSQYAKEYVVGANASGCAYEIEFC